MGDRLLLDKPLAPALAAAGIRSAQALFALGGDLAATSVVARVDLPVEGTAGKFHLKLYRYPSWGASRGLLGRGTLFGTAPEVKEFRNLAFLRENGVSAVRPIAAAALAQGGRLVAHALLTEHVEGSIDLATRITTPGDPVRDDPAVRRRVAEFLGRQVHRMHMQAFCHRDLRARNVLVRLDDGDVGVFLCDVRRGGPPSFRWKYEDDLAQLDADLVGRWSRRSRVGALRAYAGKGADVRVLGTHVADRRARRTDPRGFRTGRGPCDGPAA
jgi:hypothetical protein